MKLAVLTRFPNLFSTEKAKGLVNKILGRKRGPGVVVESLTRGLRTLDIDFKINPSKREIFEADIVHVVIGADALAFCIDAKRKGHIEKLIAGPSIVVQPTERDGIMLSPEIDLILFPSKWPKDYYVSKHPELESKIKVWPAGVMTPPLDSSIQRESIVIYDKLPNNSEAQKIESILKAKGLKSVLFTYGSFKQSDFFETLESASAMIYLSESESQGIALQEAWIRDVPSFVIKKDTWCYNGDIWSDTQINAPYMTSKAGSFFADIEELGKLLNDLALNKDKYHPREYCLENLTDEASAAKYLEIIDSKDTSNI